MPSIGEMSHGFDTQGIADYIEQLRAIVLTDAAEQIRDTSIIENMCNNNWSGKAKDDYIEQLRRTANHTADQLDNLYSILVSEINAILQSMDGFDRNLFNGMQ